LSFWVVVVVSDDVDREVVDVVQVEKVFHIKLPTLVDSPPLFLSPMRLFAMLEAIQIIRDIR